MSIAALQRRLDRLEQNLAPVNSWEKWTYEEMQCYLRLLRKELAAFDGGEPLTADEQCEREAFAARAPQASVPAHVSTEELEAELAALESGEVWC